jgi:hypothetical protein
MPLHHVKVDGKGNYLFDSYMNAFFKVYEECNILFLVRSYDFFRGEKHYIDI